MQENNVLTATNPEARRKPLQIASWKHLVGFLLIGAGIVALGFLAQRTPTGTASGTSTGELARHSQAIPIYVVALVMDWACSITAGQVCITTAAIYERCRADDGPLGNAL